MATSGSETRQRCRHVVVRLTEAERAAVDAAAERAGLTVSSYARGVLLAAPPPRAARRPPVERAELARLLGELGKIGSNVNQLARAANAGGFPVASEIDATAREVRATVAAVLAALGR